MLPVGAVNGDKQLPSGKLNQHQQDKNFRSWVMNGSFSTTLLAFQTALSRHVRSEVTVVDTLSAQHGKCGVQEALDGINS